MPKGQRLQLTSKRFGKWLVIGEAKREPGDLRKWRCRCDCGTETEIPTGNLRSGMSTQCKGCAMRNIVKKHVTTHGMAGTKTYLAYTYFKKRGKDPWGSFEAFFEDVDHPPGAGTWHVAEKDINKPLGPGNAVWKKGRKPKVYKAQDVLGERKSQAEWGKTLGISRERVRQLVAEFGNLEAAILDRAAFHGVSPKTVIAAFTEHQKIQDYSNVGRVAEVHESMGIKATRDEWAEKLSCTTATISRWIHSGGIEKNVRRIAAEHGITVEEFFSEPQRYLAQGPRKKFPFRKQKKSIVAWEKELGIPKDKLNIWKNRRGSIAAGMKKHCELRGITEDELLADPEYYLLPKYLMKKQAATRKGDSSRLAEN